MRQENRSKNHVLSRRTLLTRLGAALPAALMTASQQGRAGVTKNPRAPVSPFSTADEKLLEELGRASFLFFWEQGDPTTGLVKDRNRADRAEDSRQVASIAATGFGLSGLCVAAERGWVTREQAAGRVLMTLHFLWEKLPHEHGFYYHFIDARNGERVWKCELSSIDTAILLCGVLTCRQYFSKPEIQRLARQIYERVEWPWLLGEGQRLGHGWKPETGFLKAQWGHYCELMMLYLLAVGSPTYPIPPAAWQAWKRPFQEYGGYRYISGADPLFVHQYSHAWYDFRNRRDAFADYFQNSVAATRAHRAFCLDLRTRFPKYSEDLWGITASDSAQGYQAWGGPPEQGKLDGSIVPCAAAGSLPFLPAETMRVLRCLREQYGTRIWKRYGFVDAFNPHNDWVNPDVIGIDLGITLLMAENARSELIWKTFMRNPEAPRAMDLVGLKPA